MLKRLKTVLMKTVMIAVCHRALYGGLCAVYMAGFLQIGDVDPYLSAALLYFALAARG
ncbi:MAG: hypothetical protein AAFQ10_01435 [Pseudomonadota bacterium]